MPLSLAFAIADHPWIDSVDGAAVRIAMTIEYARQCADIPHFSCEQVAA